MMRVIPPAELSRVLPCDMWLDSTESRQRADIAVRGFRFAPSATDISLREHVIIIHRQQRAAMRRTWDGHEHAAVLEAGDVTIKHCDSTGPWSWDDSLDVLHIYLPPEALDRVAAEVYGPGFGGFRLHDCLKTRDAKLVDIGSALADEFRAGLPGAPLMIRTLSQQLAVLLVRSHGEVVPRLAEGGFSAAESRRISAHIADNLTGDLAVGTLAQVAGLGPDHFARLFRASFGCAPHQYVLKTRVERASQLLRDPALSMAEIAVEAGFSDQSHLSRLFKREIGQSPGAWRAAVLAGVH